MIWVLRIIFILLALLTLKTYRDLKKENSCTPCKNDSIKAGVFFLVGAVFPKTVASIVLLILVYNIWLNRKNKKEEVNNG